MKIDANTGVSRYIPLALVVTGLFGIMMLLAKRRDFNLMNDVAELVKWRLSLEGITPDELTEAEKVGMPKRMTETQLDKNA